MKKAMLFVAALLLLGTWAAFGYHEGLRVGLSKVPVVPSIDKDVSSLASKDLYCFGIFGGVEPCVIAGHDPNSNKVLLVPKSMTEDEPAEPDDDSPKGNSPARK